MRATQYAIPKCDPKCEKEGNSFYGFEYLRLCVPIKQFKIHNKWILLTGCIPLHFVPSKRIFFFAQMSSLSFDAQKLYGYSSISPNTIIKH